MNYQENREFGGVIRQHSVQGPGYTVEFRINDNPEFSKDRSVYYVAIIDGVGGELTFYSFEALREFSNILSSFIDEEFKFLTGRQYERFLISRKQELRRDKARRRRKDRRNARKKQG